MLLSSNVIDLLGVGGTMLNNFLIFCKKKIKKFLICFSSQTSLTCSFTSSTRNVPYIVGKVHMFGNKS